ncbi:MAG: DUF3137 domain-containing protein [Gemmatimonadaceae bacterium]
MSVGRISQLDRSTLLRIQAACNFVNAEVARHRSRVTKIGIAAFSLAAIVYMGMVSKGNTDPRAPFFGAFAVTSLALAGARKDLKKSYKGIVVQRVVKAIGNGLTYTPESTFARQDFHDMDLFDRRAENWKSEDEICGKKNAVSYSLHEVRASYTVKSGKSRREVIIFRGVIVRLDFNKHFAGHTVVVSESQSKILGGLFGESGSRKGKHLVRLENVDFEKEFSVYGTNDQEARYILTPKLMELILEAQAIVGAHGDVRLSFHDNSLFVTVPEPTDRFEVSLFGGKVTPDTVMGDLAEVVRLAERLVDTLDLETRIWSRV